MRAAVVPSAPGMTTVAQDVLHLSIEWICVRESFLSVADHVTAFGNVDERATELHRKR